jgi:hypothetical protein
MDYIRKWVNGHHLRLPQTEFYDKLLASILAPSNRLPLGSSDRVFSEILRRVVYDIMPFTRNQYEGEDLGLLIIEKLMPPYIDAAGP